MIENAPSGRPRHVIIVGGGFSGTLLAVNLVRHGGPRATIVERRARPARGTAYSTGERHHLLNVRASSMSAFPDAPDHFERWLAHHAPDCIGGFAPRALYGDYLATLLDEARSAQPGRLAVKRSEAVAASFTDDRVTVRTADGEEIVGDLLVLAAGNLPPHPIAGLDPDRLPQGRYVGDPWGGDLPTGLAPDADVLFLGAGLTMIDVALWLDHAGFEGRMIALSRRGLLPHAHMDHAAPFRFATRPEPKPLALLRSLRWLAESHEWRGIVDALRPYTQQLWQAAPDAERRRFLRHLRTFWDIHRHRIAPAVSERIAALQAQGRLTVLAGKLAAVEPDGDRLRITYRGRGETRLRAIEASHIVNCTGVEGNLDRARDPLLRGLVAQRRIRPDRLRIGIDVTAQSQAIDATGTPDERLLVVGPMTRGAFWEIVAVPDIRRQVWDIARRMANAHWVGGEGL